MALEFAPNTEPRFYARPQAFRAQVGAAAITSFPSVGAVGAQPIGTLAFSAQPANGSSLTINGVAVTFLTSGGFSLASILATIPPGGAAPVPSVGGVPLPFAVLGATGLTVNIGLTLSATWPIYWRSCAPGRIRPSTICISAFKAGRRSRSPTG